MPAPHPLAPGKALQLCQHPELYRPGKSIDCPGNAFNLVDLTASHLDRVHNRYTEVGFNNTSPSRL